MIICDYCREEVVTPPVTAVLPTPPGTNTVTYPVTLHYHEECAGAAIPAVRAIKGVRPARN